MPTSRSTRWPATWRQRFGHGCRELDLPLAAVDECADDRSRSVISSLARALNTHRDEPSLVREPVSSLRSTLYFAGELGDSDPRWVVKQSHPATAVDAVATLPVAAELRSLAPLESWLDGTAPVARPLHGDFVPANLIVTSSVRIVGIDPVLQEAGLPEDDAARFLAVVMSDTKFVPGLALPSVRRTGVNGRRRSSRDGQDSRCLPRCLGSG
jgi:hypothetical protein